VDPSSGAHASFLPSDEIRTLVGLVLQAGGSVVSQVFDPPGLRIEIEPHRRVPLLGLMASHDGAWDPRVRAIAAPIAARAASMGARGQLAALLAAVQTRVAYVDEGPDWFVRPYWVWARGYGDCDCSATLLAAMASSIGLGARLVELAGESGDGHVAAMVSPDGAEWLWAETTVPGARLGERPELAVVRLRG
jgi:transglutaminase-like putative cysteine protease